MHDSYCSERSRFAEPTRSRPAISRRRFLHLALWLSVAAFVVGLIVEGFWGGTDGQTNWVDQSFGFAMWAGAATTALLAILLPATLLIGRARRVIGVRRPAARTSRGDP